MNKSSSNLHWLITGGCGFIGSALIERLLKSGHHVRVVDDLSVGQPEDLPGKDWVRVDPDTVSSEWAGRELINLDIRDAANAVVVCQGADVIVHLAANTGVAPSVENPRLDCETNVLGTFNYLEGARINNVHRFVLASSGAPLGKVEPPMNEEKPARPLSPYGASKLAGEGYCSAYNGSFGISTVALRFGNIFGPGSVYKNSVVAKFIKCAIAGSILEIYGDGSQTRDFIYIDDLLEALIRAGTYPGIGGETFQIASSTERTITEVANVIAAQFHDRTGRDAIVHHIEALPFEVRRNFSDTSKARRILGFEIKTEFEDGIARTLDYFMGSL